MERGWTGGRGAQRGAGAGVRASKGARAARRVLAVALATAVLLAAFALVGCGTARDAADAGGASTGFPVTVTDDASRKVTIEREPERVISLAPANTEIVNALGLLDRLVGVTTWDDYPADVSDIPKMGDFTTPNLEAIAAADPDLILVTGGVQADVLDKLEGTDAAVLVVDPTSIDGVGEAIEMVAAACGVPEEGERVHRELDSRIRITMDAIEGAEPVTCFVEVGYDPLFTAGKGTLIDDMIRAAGGRNVVTEDGYVGYSAEALLSDQPAVYLGTESSIGETSTIGQRPGYATLTAVREGRVYPLVDNWVSRPGPRIEDGIEQIARALHPDRF